MPCAGVSPVPAYSSTREIGRLQVHVREAARWAALDVGVLQASRNSAERNMLGSGQADLRAVLNGAAEGPGMVHCCHE